MEISIRRAMVADAMQIAEIIQLAFDDVLDMGRFMEQVLLANTQIHVAVVNDQVVGLVENFVTCSRDNQLRLELDLLAVRSDFRGRGVGYRLVAHSMQLAQQCGVAQVRVLVAVDNGRMHRLCARFGLMQDTFESSLYVNGTSHSHLDYQTELTAHFLQVHTLTYAGIWIEGALSQMAINNAQLLMTHRQLDIVGVVCPKSDNRSIQLLQQNDFEHIHDYHRWTFNLRSD